MRFHPFLIIALSSAAWSSAALAQASPSAFTAGTRYDAAGNVTGKILPDPDGAGPLHYGAVRNSYDSAGRLIKVETGELSAWQSEAIAPSAWTGFTVFKSVTTTYDVMGRKLSDSLLSASAVVQAVTQYSYDALGRLECTAARMNPAAFGSLPASACTLGTAGTNGPDRITRNLYDGANQLTKIQRAYASPLQQDYATYTYTSDGKQASMTDARGYVATMTYDGFDRQSQWNFPSPTTPGITSSTDYEAYGYDPNGNRTSLRKRDASTLTYSFDALNRMTLKHPSIGSDVYYGYDLRGLQLYARFGSTSGQGITVAYDNVGRPASSASNVAGASLSLSYQFDADGNRIRVTHPDGTYFTTDYDGLDRATTFWENGATSLETITYDAEGRRLGVSRVNGTATSFTYDAAGRLYTLGQDLAGSANDLTLTFAYNPASQTVTRTSSNDAYAWTAALTTNRSYTANGLNQYTMVGPAAPGYDANGNLTSDGSTTYGYDIENRLVTASGAHSATLAYDPLGRLASIAGTATTRLLYDGDELVAEYDGTGTLLRRYVHGAAADDPQIWYEGATLTDRRFLHADEQGSVVAISNAGGVVGIDRYDEYGNPQSTNVGRFQFTGQAWIAELGLYHYKARIYSPTLGRFLQTDPVGYGDQLSLYAYVGNDPVNKADPTGTIRSPFLGIPIRSAEGLTGTDASFSSSPREGDGSNDNNSGNRDQSNRDSKSSSDQSTPNKTSPQPQNVGLLAGDHDYTAGPNLICPASWGCSASLVGSVYSQVSNAVPGNTSAGSVVSGNSYTVRFAGVPVGEVQSYVGSGGLTINNITQWDHVLAQGYANRNAYQSGGSWYSVTHGSGTNYYGGVFMAVINQLAGPGIFNSLDQSIASQLYNATHH